MNISEVKILIVDDEVDLADLVAESFIMEGFNVTKALSGDEALLLCQKEKFDVIFSDNHMPGLCGIDLLKKLKSHYESDFLFYLCSGDIRMDIDAFKADGGEDIIPKPYDLFSVMDKIKLDLEKI